MIRTVNETVDVVVAGGGTAGHIAALQAARAGVKTSVIEAGSMLGGTMTAGGVGMPDYFFSTKAPVVQGIGWELYKKSKEVEGIPVPNYKKRRPVETPGHYSYINIPIYVAVAEEEAIKANVILHYHEFIADVRTIEDYWEIVSLGRGIKRVTRAKEIIDCTGDSDVVRILGLGVLWAEDRQPGTYEYRIEGIEYGQLWQGEVQTIFEEALESGILQEGDFAYSSKMPFMSYLIRGCHNANHIYGSNTSDADGQTVANLEGRERMLRMFTFLRTSIPGCERVQLKTMYSYALARETYRIEGEYVITKDDFMNAIDFEDKVCNAFNYVDMHSQNNGVNAYFLESDDLIPKIPFRALIPKRSSRITVAGRNVSADRMAHAAIRAMCTCMAMGQAMGAAAALAITKGIPSKEVDSRDVVALTIEHGAVPI